MMPVRLAILIAAAAGSGATTSDPPAGAPLAGAPPSSVPKTVRIPAGSFVMGYSTKPLPASLLQEGHDLSTFTDGDADESPSHTVTLDSFELGVSEVTNIEYEQFDPSHRSLRGRGGFSKLDNEAVVFVSYENATRYAAWLAQMTGKPYRLPTEAEWEYAARGSDPSTNSSYFWTGNNLPTEMTKAMNIGSDSQGGLPSAATAVSLAVGRFAPNSFGLHDVLGNVEEWCADWHGSYTASSQNNPTGPATGIFRVTRGGSHSTYPYYLRTANRHGALPEDRSWLIGFRVAVGSRNFDDSAMRSMQIRSVDETQQMPPSLAPGYVPLPKGASWPRWSEKPMPPVMRRYVTWPGDGHALPFSGHNHEPTITACPNGDFVANWYSSNCGEEGRCVGLVQARLRNGSDTWTTASIQLDAPDRNQCCTAFYFDRDSGVLYHFSAISAAGSYKDIMGILQWSTDCGETFTKPKIVWPDHGIAHQIVVTIIKSRKGDVLIPCDRWGTQLPYGPSRNSQSIIQHAPIEHIADPASWRINASAGLPATPTQSHHTSLVELRNGSFAAIGRSYDINGMMPYALSTDGGHVWTAKQSSFTGIHGGQREVMIRLGSIDQPLMHCTFANSNESYENGPTYKTTWIPDSAGGRFAIRGVYCAISDDDGDSWETRRPITADVSLHGRKETGSDGAPFTMSYNSSEPAGYMAAAVSDDGIITLITSRNSYSFNLAWLRLKASQPTE